MPKQCDIQLQIYSTVSVDESNGQDFILAPSQWLQGRGGAQLPSLGYGSALEGRCGVRPSLYRVIDALAVWIRRYISELSVL